MSTFVPRHIGIMQGRLVAPTPGRFQCFPRDEWALEFRRAAEAGLDTIEWIYDAFGADVNPLATDSGVASMTEYSATTNVGVRSVCADYFMDKPFLRVSTSERAERVQHLVWLVGRCEKLRIERIVLPFVDASRIEDDAEVSTVVDVLEAVLPIAERAHVELHLETALNPSDFARLLSRVPSALVKVNYDSGNSASLGFKPQEEFAAYGARVGSVHIKDRKCGSTTVALGTGDCDFTSLKRSLVAVAYRGDLVLQAARGLAGDEVALARHNVSFVRGWLRSEHDA